MPTIEIQPPSSEQLSNVAATASINPDKPPWGVPVAFLTWWISVLLLLIVPLLVALPYFLYRVVSQGSAEGLGNDPNLIFISILGVSACSCLTFMLLLRLQEGELPCWQLSAGLAENSVRGKVLDWPCSAGAGLLETVLRQ